MQRGFDLPVSEREAGLYPVIMSNGIGAFHSKYKAKAPGVVTGRSGTIGNLTFVETDYWPHNTALWVTDFKNNDAKYIYYLYLKLDLKRFGTGSGVPTLNRNDVHDTITNIPSVSEQKQISRLFSNLDNLIALHQRKLKLLKQLKQAYLQVLFPNEDEKSPKVRFAHFEGDWEQRKLGDVANIIGGGTPSTNNEEYWNGNIDWYSPAEIGDKTYINGSRKKITECGFKNSSAKILPVGTVLFTSRAGIGNTAILTKEGTTNQGFQSIVPHTNLLNSYFIYSRTSELKRFGETIGAGSTFVEVSGKQMAKMPMLFPVIEEQNKIGDLFKKIDNLIDLHQKKIAAITKLKSLYLQKMFC